QLRKDCRLRSARRHFAHGDTAEVEKAFAVERRGLASTDHDEARHRKTARHHDVEARAALAAKALGFRRARHHISRAAERFASGGAERELVIAEYDQNSLGRRREG